MLPFAGDVAFDLRAFIDIDILHKGVAADEDGVLRPFQFTGKVVGLHHRPVQLIGGGVVHALLHIRQGQVFCRCEGTVLFVYRPVIPDIGATVFVRSPVGAAAKIKTDAGASLSFCCNRTGLIYHLVPAVGNQDAVAPIAIRLDLRLLGNNQDVPHAVHPDARTALAVGKDIRRLGHCIAGTVNVEAHA